ncbi:MAG: hypothetical protein J6T74_06540 [Clostridia bacterium]|nr:hypothetical protein [Clostridia bacterium]
MRKKKNLGVVLRILKILQTETDSEHLITQKEIIKMLKKDGINCRRYTIERNLDTIKALGYDVVTIKGTGTYLNNHGLNANDVYVLLEGINRANFALERGYVEEIQDKLLANLNKYEIEELKNKNMIV